MTERAIYLLCGGRSRRLGRDKRLLDVGGRPLIEASLAQLSHLGLPIFLGLDPTQDSVGAPAGIGRWWDVEADRGPLPNLLVALRRWGGEILLCPADRLLPEPTALTRLLERADGAPEAHAVVFEIGGQLEPLHGLYRPGLMAALSGAWENGQESLRDFLSELPESVCARLPVTSLGIDLNSRTELPSARKLETEAVWQTPTTN